MKLAFFAFVFVLCSFAQAGGVKSAPTRKAAVGRSDLQRPKVGSKAEFSRKGAVFMLGYDVRFERNQEQEIRQRPMMNIAGGMEWSPWMGLLEYTSFKEATADGSVSIDRKVETLYAWAYWQPTEFNLITPFLGGGVGAMKTQVTTNLGGASDEDSSPWQMGLGASLGVRFWPRSHLWLSAEGRVYKSQQLDPDPMLGGLVRLGFVIW
ncbi:MAG: outer membrane beta-barrel protein [Bdellovibrionaceae bacterium]|nr:outer membrane beta-barrel protein [Pseudobdellovibrionaceae bacterium]